MRTLEQVNLEIQKVEKRGDGQKNEYCIIGKSWMHCMKNSVCSWREGIPRYAVRKKCPLGTNQFTLFLSKNGGNVNESKNRNRIRPLQ